MLSTFSVAAPSGVDISGVVEGVAPAISAIAVAFFSWLKIRKQTSSSRSLREQQGSDDQITLVKFEGTSASEESGRTDAGWQRIRVAYLVAGVISAVSCIILFAWFYSRLLYEMDASSYLVIGGAVLLEATSIQAFKRFSLMSHVSLEEARSSRRRIEVSGDFERVVRRTRKILKKMRTSLKAVDITTDKARLEAASATTGDRLMVVIETLSEGRLSVDVESHLSPTGTSAEKNRKRTKRFVEQLTGVRVYEPPTDHLRQPKELSALQTESTESGTTG